ncbi:MAG TPA: ribosome small subunit-dependent GTPase A [Flavobacteriaceae bacterium]|nr:ribosome small subunit-dependent GTPase A [Flavobacteriaceae bacterium]
MVWKKYIVIKLMVFEGIVYKSTGSWYLVKCNNDFFECRIKGKIRLKDLDTTNPIAVGDNVIFEKDPKEKGQGVISEILPRKNYIIRKSVKLSKHSHILASNIDLALLLITKDNPPTSFNFIDRFLVTCEAYHIPVILVFNKIDTYNEDNLSKISKIESIYKSTDYQCIRISAKYGQGVDEISNYMEDKVCLLSGHSGVGKSTLINQINPELELKTKEISISHSQGKHTTTYAEMYDLKENIRIIDSPGIKGFGLVDISKYELGDYFPEFFKRKGKCKFHNCMHVEEPGCEIKKALENQVISESRYSSYVDLLSDQNIYRKSDESSNPKS